MEPVLLKMISHEIINNDLSLLCKDEKVLHLQITFCFRGKKLRPAEITQGQFPPRYFLKIPISHLVKIIILYADT